MIQFTNIMLSEDSLLHHTAIMGIKSHKKRKTLRKQKLTNENGDNEK